MYFSKSKYCGFCQCVKLAWLDKYMPDKKEISESVESRYAEGHIVGELAQTLFGEFVETTVLKDNGELDISAMLKITEDELKKGTSVICEAAFSHNGFYCAVDILHKENDGYAIYEVKSSTKKDVPKYVYLTDIAYQKYVLEKIGLTVSGTFLVQLNKDFVKQGEIDVEKLFVIQDVGELITEEYAKIDDNLSLAEEILSSDVMPKVDLKKTCFDDDAFPVCEFWKFCTKDLPSPNVFDVKGLKKDFMVDYCRKGIVSFKDLENNVKLSKNQMMQVEYELYDKGIYADKEKIKEFLGTLSYPLYFLDFETMQSAIPQFDGTKPYQQIPFQYSLHYVEEEGGEVKHKEFLAKSGENPLRAIAESLCENIPMNVCTLAYKKEFECGRIKELAMIFPDLSGHLLNIQNNIIDLVVPFRSKYYYQKEMCGFSSIKKVLPAMFPDNPELNYDNLEGVHNGTEASELFLRIKDMPEDEAKKAYDNLLKYCCLDTFAMIKIWQELIRVVNE